MGYTTPSTPEPKTVIPGPEQSNLAIVMETAPTNPHPAKRRRLEAQRNLSVSQAINADSIIHAFCNLIIAGLLLHQPEQKVYRLEKQKQTINFQTCIVIESGNTCPKICNLESTIKGRAKSPSFFQRTTKFLGGKGEFYLIGRINGGSTFNIFRAVTGEKHECVVKMYIAEYDEDGRKIPQFDANGKEAVTCEMKRHHNIYPNLKTYVWTERLSGRHCLILPFFMDVPIEARSSSLNEISQLYQANFLPKMYEYKPECVRWRNVGRLPTADSDQHDPVLYNLRGLRKIKQGEGDARTDIMCEDGAIAAGDARTDIMCEDRPIAAADNMEEDGCGRVDREKLSEILRERMG